MFGVSASVLMGGVGAEAVGPVGFCVEGRGARKMACVLGLGLTVERVDEGIVVGEVGDAALFFTSGAGRRRGCRGFLCIWLGAGMFSSTSGKSPMSTMLPC